MGWTFWNDIPSNFVFGRKKLFQVLDKIYAKMRRSFVVLLKGVFKLNLRSNFMSVLLQKVLA